MSPMGFWAFAPGLAPRSISLALTVGFAGFLGMTWLFPTLARAFLKPSRDPKAATSVRQLSLLIPAHNEESVLKKTILSMQAAIAELHRMRPEIAVRIHVGADGCTDETSARAQALGARVSEFNSQGKWKTLKSLFNENADADWIAFVDCGIQWPSNLLVSALPFLEDRDTMGIAPAYRAKGGGKLEDLAWNLERGLKDLESTAGGPVAIHGATVLYRARELRGAFNFLGERVWLNDDVVLPLLLRSRHGNRRIQYLADVAVFDELKKVEEAQNYTRRRRLALGNVQWIREIFPAIWKGNPIATILALRRVFRMFWAYWSMALVIGLTGAFAISFTNEFGAAPTVTFAAAVFLAAVVVITRYRGAVMKLAQSASVSFLVPFYLFALRNVEKTKWK